MNTKKQIMENNNNTNGMETKKNSLFESLKGCVVISCTEDMTEEDISRMIEEAAREQAEEERQQAEAAYEAMMASAEEDYLQSMIDESFIHDPEEVVILLKQMAAQEEIKAPDSGDLRDSQ